MKKILLFSLLVSIYSKAQTICNGTFFMCGSSVYSTGGYFANYPKNCLSYNKDLNAISWIHRASSNYGLTYSVAKSSIQSTWLNINTNTWDSMLLYVGQNHLARYPSGTIFNPIGNVAISNAYMIGMGPALALNGTDWIGTWYSVRQPSGSYHAITPALNDNSYIVSGSSLFGNTIANDNVGSPNSDMQQVGNVVFSAGNLIDLSVSSIDNPFDDMVSTKGGVISKATYTGSGFTWSSDSIIPNFYIGSLGYLSKEKMRIAFAPDGQTGYAVLIGRLATNNGNNSDSTLNPIVYKTTDGGTTWSTMPILPSFDWTVLHPEMLQNVGCLLPQKSNQFMLYSGHGIGITVDSTNMLHIVGVVTNPLKGTSATLDSIAVYSNMYHWDYRTHHPIIWDMMTDGTTWNTILVDSIKTSEITSSDTASYLDNWANLYYGARIQVSRSTTGGKIFYSWADSDSSITHNLYNINPNIYLKSYDISAQMVTSTSVVTDTGICYFHYLSDISYFDNSANAWVCPLVYTTDSIATSPYTGTVVRYNYINCAEFYPTDYNSAASVYKAAWTTSISKISSANDAVGQNYPNPFNQKTLVTINLVQDNKVDFNVYNLLGSLVYSKTIQGTTGNNTLVFDGSILQAGVYYYTTTIGTESITKKMIIQK